MYSQRFGTVTREFKGPTPKAVIIVSTGCLCGELRTFSISWCSRPAWVPSPGKQLPDAVSFKEDKVHCSSTIPLTPTPSFSSPTSSYNHHLGLGGCVFPSIFPKWEDLTLVMSCGCGRALGQEAVPHLYWLWFNCMTLDWSCNPWKTVYRKGIGL